MGMNNFPDAEMAQKLEELEARNRQQEHAIRTLWAVNAKLRGRVEGLVRALERLRSVRPTRRLSAHERAERWFR